MIKLASPDIREEDIQRMGDVLRSGNLIQGEYVAEFEKALALYCNSPHSAVVSSGTAALHLGLMACGIQPGDYVVVPAFTFPATANVVELMGAHALFCDVDACSYVMTPELLTLCLQSNAEKPIKAVMVVHEFGYPAPIKSISKICRDHELTIIEDAACALGTVADGFPVGAYSDLACFSFHPRKSITSGEGGAVICMNPQIIERIRRLRNHGIEKSPAGLDFGEAGLNYRMTEFQAALILGQLDRLDYEIRRKKELSEIYTQLLCKNEWITCPEIPAGHSLQSYMIVLDRRLDRRDIIDKLYQHGIETNLGAQALPALSYYRHKYHSDSCTNEYSAALNLYRQGLVLPLYGKLTNSDIVYIASTLCESIVSIIN